MKAMIYRRYGGAEVLELADLPKPEPGPGEVRVRVRASSINAGDYRILQATPFIARLHNGLLRPRRQVLGFDVAGEIDALGEGVSQHALGDAVFGNTFRDHWGGFAQWCCVSEKSVVPKPANLSWEEAATVPLAGVTALQAVRDVAKIEPGQDVLVQGAGGGVGSFAVQLAVRSGARVVATCGPRSLDLVASLGADEVIDYHEADVTERVDAFDVVLAINGFHPLRDYARCLRREGRYVMCGGTNRQIFAALLGGALRSWMSAQTFAIVNQDPALQADDLRQLAAWLEAGELRTVIDRTWALEQLPEAMAYVLEGHVRGKVAITC